VPGASDIPFPPPFCLPYECRARRCCQLAPSTFPCCEASWTCFPPGDCPPSHLVASPPCQTSPCSNRGRTQRRQRRRPTHPAARPAWRPLPAAPRPAVRALAYFPCSRPLAAAVPIDRRVICESDIMWLACCPLVPPCFMLHTAQNPLPRRRGSPACRARCLASAGLCLPLNRNTCSLKSQPARLTPYARAGSTTELPPHTHSWRPALRCQAVGQKLVSALLAHHETLARFSSCRARSSTARERESGSHLNARRVP
jgi:hypothetical protein